MSATGQSIGFAGLVRDGFGIALWQADGTGPEPAATGHRFVTPIETITAHYYIASRDYVDVAARGGLCGTALLGAWPQLRTALGRARRSPAELIIHLPLTTAGADREGEDWFYENGVETRFLRPQAPLPLALQSQALIEFVPPRLVLTEDYRSARQFADVCIALVSESMPARLARGALDGPFAEIAEAFLADLAGRSVRFVVDAIQLTSTTFAGSGRTSGRLAEIPAARVDVV